MRNNVLFVAVKMETPAMVKAYLDTEKEQKARGNFHLEMCLLELNGRRIVLKGRLII